MRLLILLAFAALPMVAVAAPPATGRKAAQAGKAAAKPAGEKVTYVASSDDADYYFIDSSERTYGENGRYVIAVINYKALHKGPFTSDKPYLSEAQEIYFKCSGRFEFGNSKDFSGAMGSGDLVDEETDFTPPKDDDEFDDAEAGTVVEALLRAACKITPAH
jgi:hypothetical protein